MGIGLWCEFMPYGEVVALLPALARRGLSLHLAIQAVRAEEPDLFRLLAGARERGVEVRAWILLGAEEGYWPSAHNVELWADRAMALAGAAEQNGTPFEWVIADLEPPPALIEPLARLLAQGRYSRAWRGMLALPRAPRSARGRLARAIDTLHARGTRVQAVTLPLALDGSGALMAHLGIDFLELPWDEVTFMAYRPEFMRLVGPLSADLVERYARDARRRFGERASLAIGEVGTPGFPAPVPGYRDPRDIQADLAACRAAGMVAASIYSLDGICQEGGVGRWLDAPPEEAPRSEPKAGLVRLALAAASGLLPEPE